MPSLSPEAVHKYWHEYKDPIIYRVISFMEAVENWTLDGDPALETAINQLAELLDDMGDHEYGKEDELIKIASFMKAGRALRLLQCLDSAKPGSASKLLMHAEQVSKSSDDLPGLFLRRNVVFERLRLLARVFAKRRFNLITKALEDEEHV